MGQFDPRASGSVPSPGAIWETLLVHPQQHRVIGGLRFARCEADTLERSFLTVRSQIGSGPGGYVAAIRAAQLGMATAVVEKDNTVGGRCLNYACIPAKAVLRSADILIEVREAGEYGVKVAAPEVDFAAVMERRAKVVQTLTSGVAGLSRKKNKIELVQGEGSLTADGKVKVGEDLLSAKVVVLATGSAYRGAYRGSSSRRADRRDRGSLGLRRTARTPRSGRRRRVRERDRFRLRAARQ